MSVKREGVRSIAAVLRGIISLADGPSYINAANQVYKAMEDRGLIIEQQPHYAIVDDSDSTLTIEISHPDECLLDPDTCELKVRLDSYYEDEEGAVPVDKAGQYVLDWDEVTPWDLGFKKTTAAQRKEIATRGAERLKKGAVAPPAEEARKPALESATAVIL